MSTQHGKKNQHPKNKIKNTPIIVYIVSSIIYSLYVVTKVEGTGG